MVLLLCVVLAAPAARAADPQAEAPISSVPQPLLKNFSIFHTPSETVPLEIAEGIAKTNATAPPFGGHGFNVALGQEIVLPGKHAPLWAVPGRDQVMLFDQPKKNGGYAGAATTIAHAVKRGLAFFTFVPKTHDPRLVRVKGLIPNGVTGVRLSQTAVAPVVDNAFARTIDQAKLWEGEDWILVRGRQAVASVAG
jgi:hypothetical protein